METSGIPSRHVVQLLIVVELAALRIGQRQLELEQETTDSREEHCESHD